MNRILWVTAAFCLSLYITTSSAVADVVPLTSLTEVGTTQLVNGNTVLRLTPNFDTNTDSHGNPIGASPAGAAWTPNRYNVADPFTANFQFQMSDPTGHLDGTHGGDGIAFLIQNDSPTAIGVGAGGMGFLGITDSVAIMLDTYQNATPNFYGDPSNNYIAVNTRGTDFNAPHHFCTFVPSTGQKELTADPTLPSDLNGSSFSPLCTANPTLGMTGFGGVPALGTDIDSGIHDLGVTYTGSALDIYLDSTLVLAVGIDLGTILNLQNGQDAFLGFTAGTRFAYQNQDILSFTITPEPAWSQLWVPLAMILAIGLTRKWQLRDRS